MSPLAAITLHTTDPSDQTALAGLSREVDRRRAAQASDPNAQFPHIRVVTSPAVADGDPLIDDLLNHGERLGIECVLGDTRKPSKK